jgi:hypothetical protein
MRPQVVKIFQHKQTFCSLADLSDTGDFSVGKNVLRYPGVRTIARFIPAYRVEQKDSIFIETAMHHIHECTVILSADMLEHTHRDNSVKFSTQISIIAMSNFNR